MRRLSHEEGKFAAASAAFWTGGVFIHVPKGLKLDKPIQSVYLIDEPGTAQYAHTLAVVGEQAECSVREYCLGAPFEGQALHAGGFELYARPGAQVQVAHFQDWGPAEVYDISIKRVEIARDAHVGWVPGAPRRAAHQADARHHHRREGVGHAPHRHVLHRGPGAPRPLHDRQARGGPHHGRHRVEGRAHRPLARVIRGPDPHRAARPGDPHLPADPPDAALPAGQGRRHPVADRADRQRFGFARRAPWASSTPSRSST